ncbi:MAG: hypothetical protein WA485_04435 [Candidatus Sulfotelmatobacter sp.]
MRSACLALLALSSTLFLIACGGGSSSSSTTTTPPPPTQLTLTLSGAAPAAVATQADGGSWSALALSGATATFTVPSATSNYAVAVLCPASTISATQTETIFEANAGDTTAPSVFCPPSSGINMTVSFDLTAVGGTQAYLSVGDDLSGYWPGPASGANVQNVVPGTQDVGVAAYGPNQTTTPPVGVQIQRNVNVTGAPLTLPAMTAADQAGNAPITLSGVPSGFTTQITAYYNTPGGATILINGTNVPSYGIVAAADTASGDYYSVQGSASNGSTSLVETIQSFTSAQNVALTLPGTLSYAGPTPAANPTFSATYSGFTGSGKTAWVADLLWPSSGSNSNVILVYATSTFLGSNPIAVPDLSSVTGFLAPASSGTTVDWSLIAVQQSSYYIPFETNSSPTSEAAQYAAAGGTYVAP